MQAALAATFTWLLLLQQGEAPCPVIAGLEWQLLLMVTGEVQVILPSSFWWSSSESAHGSLQVLSQLQHDQLRDTDECNMLHATYSRCQLSKSYLQVALCLQ